jgi:hypothetical protein
MPALQGQCDMPENIRHRNDIREVRKWITAE